MLSQEEILTALADGESALIEFKAGTAPLETLLRVICAFANDVGDLGETAHLIIGVDDDGLPTESPDRSTEIMQALGEGALRPAPQVEVASFALPEGRVQVVAVAPAREVPVSYQGQVYVRQGDTIRVANTRDLQRLAQRGRSELRRTQLLALQLRNYRLFRSLQIEAFHPRLTVFVAPNGAGKTAILDACARVFRPLLAELEVASLPPDLQERDIHRVLTPERAMEVVTPCAQRAEFLVHEEQRSERSQSGGSPIDWRSPPYQLVEALRRHAELISRQPDAAGESPSLPVLAYYGTGRAFAPYGRHVVERQLALPDLASTSRLSGYQESLSSSTSLSLFDGWFRRYSYAAQQERGVRRRSEERPAERLFVVQKAVDAVLRPTGWRSLHWDFPQDALAAVHPQQGRLPVSWLSGGLRTMIGLVGDLAHRCARLNPHLGGGAARLTPGVVMIDEIDLHLHPGWQQTVLGALQEAFPRIQFLVTTHSPHVLSTVAAESIRVIECRGGEGTATVPTWQTRGAESADVLAAVMGVDPVADVEEARKLSAYRSLIQEGRADSDEGQKLRAELEAHFGATHPLVLDCDRMLRFYALRRRPGAPSQDSQGEG